MRVPAAWTRAVQRPAGEPTALDRRRVADDLAARLVPRLEIHRPAARRPAGDLPVAAAPRLGLAGWRALAGRPGHEHLAGPPWVPVLAVRRVLPPVRPLHVHRMIRTRIRASN